MIKKYKSSKGASSSKRNQIRFQSMKREISKSPDGKITYPYKKIIIM